MSFLGSDNLLTGEARPYCTGLPPVKEVHHALLTKPYGLEISLKRTGSGGRPPNPKISDNWLPGFWKTGGQMIGYGEDLEFAIFIIDCLAVAFGLAAFLDWYAERKENK